MKKVGILYICTGNYTVFWEDFYHSFEENFLLQSEKHYFVFTDNPMAIKEGDRIHIRKTQALPWPLVTLFRFQTFLSAKEELEDMDYLVFSNANMKCVAPVTEEEFLPRKEMGEALFVTAHPGYDGKHVRFAPYERSRKSYAYVPYHLGEKYVIGAMNGGTKDAFLAMCQTLSLAINEDLKKNVIARWHDESQLNRYIIGRKDYRLLSCSYCFPYGMDVTYEKKIIAVSKQEKFDVKSFKGVYQKKENIIKRIVRHIKNTLLVPNLFALSDKILNRKVREYDFR